MNVNEVNVGEWQGESNGPWVKELHLIAADDVELLTIPFEADDFQLKAGYLKLKTGADVVKVDFAVNARWTEQEVDGDNGKFYECGFEMVLPKNKARNLRWFYENRNKKVLVLFRDANFGCLLAGDEVTPLSMNVNRMIGDVNMMTVNLAAVTRYPAWHIVSTDAEVLFSGGFSSGFDLGFRV
jgi:hypothetical protein